MTWKHSDLNTVTQRQKSRCTNTQLSNLINICVHKACQNLCQISIVNSFLKSQNLYPNFDPTWKPHTFFENQMLPFMAHTKNYISLINVLQNQIFVLSEIWTNLSKHIPNFLPLQIWSFWPEEPKNSNFTFSFLTHFQPKLNQNPPKRSELILILTIKQVYIYIW